MRRIVVIDHGVVIADATPREIRSRIPSKRITFTADGIVDDAPFRGLPVPSLELSDHRVRLLSNEPELVLTAQFEHSVTVRDLEVTGANLEGAVCQPDDPLMTSPSVAPLWRVLLAQTRCELLMRRRVPAFSVTNLALPVVFFIFFDLPVAHLRHADGVSIGAYLLASLGTYAVGNVMVYGFEPRRSYCKRVFWPPSRPPFPGSRHPRGCGQP